MAETGPLPAAGARIAVDCHVLDGKFQGSRTWLLKTLERAIPKAPDCRWTLYSRQRSSVEPLMALGKVEWRRIPLGSSVLRLGLFWPFEMTRRTFDTVVFQYHGPPLYPARQTLVIHDILFESHPGLFPAAMRKRLQLLVRWLAPRVPAVVTVSDWTRRELRTRLGIAADRIFVAPNGVPSRSPGAFVDRDDRTVLFVGRIEPRKNLKLLMQAFDRMTLDGKRLVVVGAAEGGSDALLRQIDTRPDMHHIARASDKELAELYETAAVLAFPSEAEGFGIPVIEALSAGLPVVASDRTAIPEVAGSFAYLFDPTAPDAEETLARLLDTAATAPLTADPAALAAHLRTFTWDTAADNFLAALARSTQRWPHKENLTEDKMANEAAG